jgi:sec-independent protein translocase protein TatC
LTSAEQTPRMSFWSHLDELRRRFIYSLIFVGVAGLTCFSFAEPIFTFLLTPLQHATQYKLVVLEPLELFMTYMRIAFVAGLFVSAPFVLWQGWQFVAPGLYQRERRWLVPFVTLGSLFFAGGAAFCFYVVLPMGFVYLTKHTPAMVESHFSIAAYVNVLVGMMLAFGIVFELPLIMWILSAAGLVQPNTYSKFRKYWIILAFVIGGILTPPDPFSQILMAVPLLLFFELGIFGSKLIARKKNRVSL